MWFQKGHDTSVRGFGGLYKVHETITEEYMSSGEDFFFILADVA
jgi:hypothetical protein